MATKRSYGEACAAAHALDLIGERWALLVVRELLLGPKRFTDLRAGMPHASPNVLAQRLRELEQDGIVRRRKLGPPAGTWVYELTEWGQDLEPVVLALGRWGSRSPLRDRDAIVSTDAIVIAMRGLFDGQRAGDLDATFALRLGDDRFAIRVADAKIDVARGDAENADVTITTDAATLAALLGNATTANDAVADGHLELVGDAGAFERLLDAVRREAPAEVNP